MEQNMAEFKCQKGRCRSKKNAAARCTEELFGYQAAEAARRLWRESALKNELIQTVGYVGQGYLVPPLQPCVSAIGPKDGRVEGSSLLAGKCWAVAACSCLAVMLHHWLHTALRPLV